MAEVGYLRIGVAAVMVVVIYFVNAYSAKIWQSDFFFGEARSVAANRIVITDPSVLEIPFFTDENTRRYFGAGEAPPLQLYDQMMIVMGKNERGTDVIRVIRVMTKEDLRQKELPHA